MTQLTARHAVYDDFLSDELPDRLLEFALANEAAFRPARTVRNGQQQVNADYRTALRFKGEPGEAMREFGARLAARFEEFCAAAGVKPFPVAEQELEMVASLDGNFFRYHVDTLTGEARQRGTVRALTTVYYFHRRPRRFRAGELALYGFTGGEPAALIEPRHDRLLVFPSIAPHEVRAVECPEGTFADARFTVNVWFNRAVPGQ